MKGYTNQPCLYVLHFNSLYYICNYLAYLQVLHIRLCSSLIMFRNRKSRFDVLRDVGLLTYTWSSTC